MVYSSVLYKSLINLLRPSMKNSRMLLSKLFNTLNYKGTVKNKFIQSTVTWLRTKVKILYFLSFSEGNINGSGDIWTAAEVLQLEQDVLTPLAGSGQVYVYTSMGWWSQLKSAGAAIYANSHYLRLYSRNHPERYAFIVIFCAYHCKYNNYLL